ncbi:glutathione S-transferase family protein [Pseudoruegeria aquimaris]|nr:glutathione S-transferase C-terminal domain-containing protein [Pseudoruegeria aquimaris]
MIDGTYLTEDPGPDTTEGGAFKRAASTIRNWIAAGGPHPPEPGRYHLYAAWNCPWAHRALLGRAVLGLESAITVSHALPRRTEDGWVFESDGAFADTEFGAAALHEVYARQRPAYTGRITVPLLWDRAEGRIVSNESADILRMLNAFVDGEGLHPAQHRNAIERRNAEIYPKLNNGVYRAGFARTQEAYDTAVAKVFEMLDRLDAHLDSRTYLCGDDLTEADLRLFPTLARFDVAYHYAFKCNIRRLSDYGALWAYARRLHARPEIAATVRFDIYKQGYFSPSPLRNPLGIVPAGPEIDWSI